jgi:hypothetical protein
MRTTLAIDDDVLAAAKGLAALRGKSVGEVISSLAREALTPRDLAMDERNGVPLLPLRPDAKPVTLAMVNALRDELP